ncbi:MAG: PIN domain-containing protein [Candidatus Binataceae bacterium]
MATLIDSSVLVAAERGTLDLDAFLASRPNESFAVSAITASELLHGLLRATSPRLRGRRQLFVQGILSNYPVIAFHLISAQVHAELWADLAKRGSMIGQRDLLIAATVIAHRYDLATRDLRSFPRTRGLKLLRL